MLVADDLSANEQLIGPHASGVNSILPKEHGSQFFYLPIIKHNKDEVNRFMVILVLLLVVSYRNNIISLKPLNNHYFLHFIC